MIEQQAGTEVSAPVYSAARLPCLHIGYPKAASTTLQTHFFPGHPGLLNLSVPKSDPLITESIHAMLAVADTTQRGKASVDQAKYRAIWQDRLAAAAQSGKVAALSLERLTNPLFYRGPADSTLAELLHDTIGPCRIVIMLRDQLHLAESYYLHMCKVSSYLPPNQWLGENWEVLLPMLRYDQLVGSYARVFGKENVGVFLFEELRDDPAAFAARLCGFIGVEPKIGQQLLVGKRENVRRSSRLFWYVALRSRFLPQARLSDNLPSGVHLLWRRFLQGGGKAGVQFAPEWTHKMEELYRTANANLLAQYPLPLERFGYRF
jgi:hypothetical protein